MISLSILTIIFLVFSIIFWTKTGNALIDFSRESYIPFQLNNGEKLIKEYIIDNLHHNVTTFDVKGGFLEKKRKILELAEKYSSQRMKEIAATLTEESNPVIIVATLK